MYPKTECIWKRLGFINNFVSKNFKYANDAANQLIFDKLVYDFYPYKKRLFYHKQTKEKLTIILQLVTQICSSKNNII
jgi:hypothetical protein